MWSSLSSFLQRNVEPNYFCRRSRHGTIKKRRTSLATFRSAIRAPSAPAAHGAVGEGDLQTLQHLKQVREVGEGSRWVVGFSMCGRQAERRCVVFRVDRRDSFGEHKGVWASAIKPFRTRSAPSPKGPCTGPIILGVPNAKPGVSFAARSQTWPHKRVTAASRPHPESSPWGAAGRLSDSAPWEERRRANELLSLAPPPPGARSPFLTHHGATSCQLIRLEWTFSTGGLGCGISTISPVLV